MYRPPELGSLRTELRNAGVFEHRELRSWLKFGVLLSGIAACLLAVAMLPWWIAFIAIPLAAVFSTALAMLGHEGSHRSFSASPRRNAFLTNIAFPVFSGLGAMYWHNKHDRLHHGHPNVEGQDPDIKPFPFVSSRGDYEKGTKRERWFQRNFQAVAFWPMATLMTIGMRRSSILYLLRTPCQEKLTREWFSDLVCLSLHYVLWLIVPALIFGPAVTIGIYLSIWGLSGICLALVFAPAHIGLPIVTEQNKDWLHQVETTRNLELPRLISFFFIGLDYQVEHHLFPKIPHQNLPKAAKITRAWCEKHGVIYLTLPYLDALVSAATFMANGWDTDALDPIEVRAGLIGHRAAA